MSRVGRKRTRSESRGAEEPNKLQRTLTRSRSRSQTPGITSVFVIFPKISFQTSFLFYFFFFSNKNKFLNLEKNLRNHFKNKLERERLIVPFLTCDLSIYFQENHQMEPLIRDKSFFLKKNLRDEIKLPIFF